MTESSSLPVPTLPPDADDRRQIERRNEDRRKLERTSVRSLLALLLSGGALAVAIVALWLQFDAHRRATSVQMHQEELSQEFVKLREALAETNDRIGVNAQQLATLNRLAPRVSELGDSISELRGRMESGRRAWTLAEARYLLEVANRGLTLARDSGAALAALEAADAQLKELRDPGLNGVRSMLAKEIQSLRLVPQPDLTGIAVRLESAEELSAKLTVVGAIPSRYRPESTEESSAPGFARAWQLLRSSVTNMISIRRIGKDAVELVSLEEQNVRRQHLQLLLFSARLAAVRGDNEMFHKNLDGAQKWLAEMFDPRDAGVASVNGTLSGLTGIHIAPALPDISASLHLLDRLILAGEP